MLNIDLEEAHLTVEAEAVISPKEWHCVTAGITKSGSLGRCTLTVRGEVRQALHCLLHDRGSVAVVRCLDTSWSADGRAGWSDLPLNFHPAAIRASAVFITPLGAVGATGGNA